MVENRKRIEDYASKNNCSYEDLFLFPKYIALGTTSICNACCSMCIIDKWNKSVPVMEDAVFNKIIQEIKPHTNFLKQVIVQNNGEPLLDKNLEKRIAKLKNIGIKKVSFSTNGSLMTEKRAITVLNSGVDEVVFSIDGISQESYSQIRHGLNFNTVIKNAINFFTIRNQNNYKTTCSIRMVVQECNKHEKNKLYNFWKDYIRFNDRIITKPIDNWGNQLQHNMQRDYFDKLNKEPCITLFGTLTILSNANVVLCCADPLEKYVLGNLKNQTISEIWNGETLEKLRKIHLCKGRASLPICVNCDTWDTDMWETNSK